MLKQFTSKKNLLLKLTLALLIAILLIFSANHYFMRPSNPGQSYSPPEKITIAYSATADTVLADVAQVKGYYLTSGLDVTAHKLGYGKLALAEVLEGKADFATVAETPVVLSIMNDQKISVIATIQTSSKGIAIVARKDSGIHTPADLKGKRIGVTLGTIADFYMDSVLSLHGIRRQEVIIVDIKAEELRNALAEGEVDAVSAFNPYLVYAQKTLGTRGITFFDPSIYQYTFNIVAKQDFIRANPDKVKKLLRALVKADEFVNRNPDEAPKIVADFTGMDVSVVKSILKGTDIDLRLNQSLVLAMEDESEWAIKNKLTDKKQIPNYLDFIYLEGLESVKPDAVRILR